MLNSSVKALLPQITELFVKHKIRNAYVFGSVLTERFDKDSDIDFLVNLKDDLDPVEAGGRLWDLEYELKDLLQRDVDLTTERSLKNPYFISELNSTKLAIYGQLN